MMNDDRRDGGGGYLPTLAGIFIVAAPGDGRAPSFGQHAQLTCYNALCYRAAPLAEIWPGLTKELLAAADVAHYPGAEDCKTPVGRRPQGGAGHGHGF